MKKLILFVLLIFSGMLSAQENDETETKQFKKTFRYISLYKEGRWEDFQESTNTFVFNVGENSDVIIYTANYKKEVFTRISEVEEDKTEEGVKNQYMMLLNERGKEVLLVLYETGVLKLVYDKDYQIQFNP